MLCGPQLSVRLFGDIANGGGKGGAREGGRPGRHFAGGGICGAKIRNCGVCVAMC